MSMRSLRACMVCAVVQTGSKFQAHGCPNCEQFLELAGNAEAVQECTSPVFEGSIAFNGMDGSWVARWQRLEGYVPGVYAVKVVGTVSGSLICEG